MNFEPMQLIITDIIINYWQRKQLEYYQLSWRFLWEISMEGYDLGSHMVGRQTLRLENFNLTLPNAL